MLMNTPALVDGYSVAQFNIAPLKCERTYSSPTYSGS